MTPNDPDHLAASIDNLASAIEGNTGEMKALRDAIDDLRISYEHAVRNSDCPYLTEAQTVRSILPSFPLDDALEMGLTAEQIRQAIAEGVTTAMGLRRIEKNARGEEIPESIACAHCDASSPPSLSAALEEGWTDLCCDDGPGWNYLGICPECQAQENETTESECPPPAPQKSLFG